MDNLLLHMSNPRASLPVVPSTLDGCGSYSGFGIGTSSRYFSGHRYSTVNPAYQLSSAKKCNLDFDRQSVLLLSLIGRVNLEKLWQDKLFTYSSCISLTFLEGPSTVLVL